MTTTLHATSQPPDVLSESCVILDGTGEGGEVGGKGRIEASSSASGSSVKPHAESGRRESDFADGECMLRAGSLFFVAFKPNNTYTFSHGAKK